MTKFEQVGVNYQYDAESKHQAHYLAIACFDSIEK